MKNFSSEINSLKEFIKTDLASVDIKKEEDLSIIGLDLNIESFRITFSSKALIKNCINQSNSQYKQMNTPSFLHVDGTYKLLSNGFVVIVIGTEDINHQFRLIALSVVAHEKKEAFFFALQDVKHALKLYFDFKVHPQYVKGDGADCIFLSVKELWTDSTYLLCLFHLKKAVTAKINREKDAEIKKLLKEKSPLINYGINLLIDSKSWLEFEKLWCLISKLE